MNGPTDFSTYAPPLTVDERLADLEESSLRQVELLARLADALVRVSENAKGSAKLLADVVDILEAHGLVTTKKRQR